VTTEQLSIQLKNIKQQLNGFPQWADAALGNTALAMISQRIIRRGEAAEGMFKPYSTKDMLVGASSFRTKAYATAYFGERGPNNRNSKKLKWVSIPGSKPTFAPAGYASNYRRLAVFPGGYKALRQFESSEAGHKTFLRTGAMWLSIHTLGTKATGSMKYTTEVGTKVDRSLDILKGQGQKEGKDILNINENEKAELLKALDRFITKIVDKALGNG